MLLPIIIVLLVLITVYFCFVYLLRRKIRRRTEEVATRFTGGDILLITPSANFFGQASKGMKQMRGSGMLVLTRDRLYFELYIPKRIVDIPLREITGIDTPASHLGKTKFTPLLKVVFQNEENQSDSSAWLVKDLPRWEESVRDLTGIRKADGV